MAVDRASGYRPSLITPEELTALQPRSSTIRGVPVRDDIESGRGAPVDADDLRQDILPVGDDGAQGGSSQQQEPAEIYLEWLNRLAMLARAPNPSVRAMLSAADELYVPRHTALQDIFDILGITSAADSDARLREWMSMLLRNGGDLVLDALANVLEMLRTAVDPLRNPVNQPAGFDDHVLARIQTLTDKLGEALNGLDRLQERTTAALASAQNDISACALETVAWQRYRDGLQGLSRGVQAALASDGFDTSDLDEILVAMAELRAPGEAPSTVSRAEWLAVSVGIGNTPGLPLAVRSIAAGQLARGVLIREARGELTIDPQTREDVVAARQAGEAATATADGTPKTPIR